MNCAASAGNRSASRPVNGSENIWLAASSLLTASRILLGPNPGDSTSASHANRSSAEKIANFNGLQTRALDPFVDNRKQSPIPLSRPASRLEGISAKAMLVAASCQMARPLPQPQAPHLSPAIDTLLIL
jgi:hypothetical protein